MSILGKPGIRAPPRPTLGIVPGMQTTQASARGAALAPDDGLVAAEVQTNPHVEDSGVRSEVPGESESQLDMKPALVDTEATEVDRDVDLGDAGDFNGQDVFAKFEDEAPDTGGTARAEYLSIRGLTPVRHVLVQHLQDADERPSTLGKLVTTRQPRALLLYLLVLACEHRLAHNRRLPVLTIARMLTTAQYPCSSAQARRAIKVLETNDLVKTRWTGTTVEIVPLLEDGSGEVWHQPTGDDEDPDLQRYFALPNEFFDDAVLDQLRLPGIAMLLVALKETSKESTFSISVERFADWYGISERTAERGYRELQQAGLIRTHRQLVKDSRMARGLRAKYHRTLLGAFGTQARRDAQSRARAARAATAAKAAARAKAGAR
jgi:hypothetical protein